MLLKSDKLWIMAIKFKDLPPAARTGLIILAAVDAGLRFWASSDLRSRDASEVNGSKRLWSLGLSLLSTGGVLPVVYLIRGRRAAATDHTAAAQR